MANEKGLIFQEVSAKSGLNVNNLFYKDIFDQIARKYNLGGMGEIENNIDNSRDTTQRSKFFYNNKLDNIVLDPNTDNKDSKQKKKKCC
jgi:hypothetical protein